jgi:heat shock protein HslJ
LSGRILYAFWTVTKMNRNIVFAIVFSLAAVSLSACSQSATRPSSSDGQLGESGASAVTVTDTLWKLQSIERSGEAIVPVSNPDLFTLTLGADGKMAVRADCNRCVGGYSLTGTAFAVNQGVAACTRAACSSAPLDYEYMTALTTATTVSVNGNTLECVSPSAVLRFTR